MLLHQVQPQVQEVQEVAVTAQLIHLEVQAHQVKVMLEVTEEAQRQVAEVVQVL